MAQSYQDGFGGTPVTGSTPEGFGGELVHDPNPSRIPGIQEDTEEASGGWTAFVSGLTNDEANKVFWIASKRFPEMVEEGKNPADLYAFDEDGDLFYRDPETGEYKKEFGQDWFGFEVDYIDNIGPVGQFLSEVIGSTVGMGAGYLAGGFPGAMIGGAKGSAVWGGSAYASFVRCAWRPSVGSGDSSKRFDRGVGFQRDSIRRPDEGGAGKSQVGFGQVPRNGRQICIIRCRTKWRTHG